MIQWINTIASAWAHAFWIMNLQNSLFLIITLSILYKLRNHSPRVTSLIAFIALVKLLIPPVTIEQFSGFVPSQAVAYLNILPGITTSPATMLQQPHLSVTAICFLLWFAVAGALLSVYCYRYYRFRKIAFLGEEIKPSIVPVPLRICPVVLSERCYSPYVIGFFRPRIVLPAEAAQWRSRYLEAIIAHEIGHIRQRDQWINLLQVVVQAFYFFNPLVWLLIRQFIHYRELQTDNSAVRRLNITPDDYAHILLRIAEQLVIPESHLSSPASFNKTVSSLKNRIGYQLNRKEGSMSHKWIVRYSVVMLALVMVMLPLSCDLSSTAPKEAPIVAFGELTQKPAVIKRVSAEYPESAKAAGLQGNVVLKILIGADGKVQEVEVLKSASPELDEAAINAVKQFVFTPAEKNGKPVRVWFAVPFTFRLK